jgi:hypothetical protein
LPKSRELGMHRCQRRGVSLINRCLLGKIKGDFFSWIIATFWEHVNSHSPPFKSPLSMIALTPVRNRDDEFYSVIASY